MILFGNKIKIKCEWDKLIKIEKYIKFNYQQNKYWKINWTILKKNKKPDLGQHVKFATWLWDWDNPVQKRLNTIMEVNTQAN
jgi:hypothetical protein